tara:strand:- start:646 stop:771 length:126 start_codon:yes stop_codon:yes gene_type:complete
VLRRGKNNTPLTCILKNESLNGETLTNEVFFEELKEELFLT